MHSISDVRLFWISWKCVKREKKKKCVGRAVEECNPKAAGKRLTRPAASRPAFWEPRWRLAAPWLGTFQPSVPPSSRGACWRGPPTRPSGGSWCPSWSRRRWPRWRGRSRGRPGVWCPSLRGSLGPVESPAPPGRPVYPAQSAEARTGSRDLRRDVGMFDVYGGLEVRTAERKYMTVKLLGCRARILM